jgi:hypothetical protein
MVKQKRLFVCLLLFINNILFATTFSTEKVEVRNYSSKRVVVNWEYQEGPSDQSGYYSLWDQTVCGIGLAIRDLLFGFNANIVRPNQKIVIIEYFPDWWNYDNMDALPLMDKLNSIFKKLEIVCNDGETIITLENLGERIIKKERSAGRPATYILKYLTTILWENPHQRGK